MVRAIAASEQSHFFCSLKQISLLFIASPCSYTNIPALHRKNLLLNAKNPRSPGAVLLCGLNFFIIFVDNSTN